LNPETRAWAVDRPDVVWLWHGSGFFIIHIFKECINMKKAKFSFGRAAVAVLGAAALAALVWGCEHEPAAATGKVKVSLALKGYTGEEDGLPPAVAVFTVYPGEDQIAATITSYKLAFEPKDGTGAAHAPVTVDAPATEAEVELVLGRYRITVAAYKGDTKVAEGTIEEVAVTAESGDDPEPVAVDMEPVTGTDTATGTFSYSVTIPAGASGSLTLKTQAGLSVANGTADLNATENTGTVTGLAPGYYVLAVSLELGDKTAGFSREAVHIYSGLTSAFTQEFTDDNFSAAVEVGRGLLGGLVIGWGVDTIPVGGSSITLTEPTTLSVPDDAGFTNIKWYIDGADTPVSEGSSVTLNPDEYGAGGHFLTVTASKGGKTYSEIVEFTVEADGGGGGLPVGPVSAAGLAALLASAEVPAGTPEAPTIVRLESFDVTGSIWGATVYNALNGVEKYITLDLSVCTTAGNSNKIAGSVSPSGNNFNIIKSDHVVGVILPNDLTEISTNAFRGWTGLRYVTITSNLLTIGGNSFHSTTNLKSLDIPTTVTTMAGGAFQNSGIESITIPEGVATIPAAMFETNASLTRVTFLGNSTVIANANCFANNLKDVYDAQDTKAGTYIKTSTSWEKE
jgi:hypothetical protein